MPLSDAAIAVVDEARQRARDIGGAVAKSPYVFVNDVTGQRLSKNAFPKLLERMGRNGELTAHGFRASFRTWSEEGTNFPWEVAEMALGHAVGTKVQRAYLRGDALQKRVAIMQAWADYCARLRQPTKIIPLHETRTA